MTTTHRTLASLLVILVLALGGCMAPTDDVELDTEGLRPSASTGKADGLGPRAYFEQFRYAIDESAGYYASGQPRRTRMATSWGPRTQIETAEGPGHVGLGLWLLEDGTAYADYTELRAVDAVQSVQVADRIVRTRWRVEGEQLVVDGIGTGVGVDYNEIPAIRLRFTSDVISPGLGGREIILVRASTSSRLQHIEQDYAAQQR
jgi:hypothetical protein